MNTNKSGFQPSETEDTTNNTFGIIGLGSIFTLLTIALTAVVYFQMGA